MEKTDDFRELAFLYFDGKISRADEARLYAFINRDSSNMAIFRRWEQEWLTERQDDSVMAEGWKNLQARMADKPRMEVRQGRRKPAHTRFWYLAAAVALICVAAFSFRLVMDAFRQDTEKYFVFEAPKGERSKLTLADGTVVWLNSGSALRCPADFDKKDRRVQITGEGYFEVTRQGGSEFTVNTGACDIVVKGTKFNVAAYADDEFVQATLLEGKIEFRHAGGAGLPAGDAAGHGPEPQRRHGRARHRYSSPAGRAAEGLPHGQPGAARPAALPGASGEGRGRQLRTGSGGYNKAG